MDIDGKRRIEPTYSAKEVAQLLDAERSAEWVRITAIREKIGHGPPWRFTRKDLTLLNRLVNPKETRGRPTNESRGGGDLARILWWFFVCLAVASDAYAQLLEAGKVDVERVLWVSALAFGLALILQGLALGQLGLILLGLVALVGAALQLLSPDQALMLIAAGLLVRAIMPRLQGTAGAVWGWLEAKVKWVGDRWGQATVVTRIATGFFAIVGIFGLIDWTGKL